MARIVPAVRGMYIALTLHLLWTLGAAAVITRRQRIPASAAAWLALVFLLPVAGTLLYGCWPDTAARSRRQNPATAGATPWSRSSPAAAEPAPRPATASACCTTAATPSRR
ncbi:MAG: PLDc N-terminal domain-containing protein [Alistipes shahii]